MSEGAFSSLNCGRGSGDDPARVAANRARAMERIGAESDRLATAYQVHSAKVALAEAPWPAESRPRVDALVTRTPGLALGTRTPIIMNRIAIAYAWTRFMRSSFRFNR